MSSLDPRDPLARALDDAIAGRRDKIFLATKVLPSNASYDGTLRACGQSLVRLGVQFIDLIVGGDKSIPTDRAGRVWTTEGHAD